MCGRQIYRKCFINHLTQYGESYFRHADIASYWRYRISLRNKLTIRLIMDILEGSFNRIKIAFTVNHPPL